MLRSLSIWLLVACFMANGVPALHAQTSGSNADITAAAGTPWASTSGGTPPDTSKFMTLIGNMRGFAVVLILIALCVAAISAAMGKQGMAISVAIGAVALFGGFWIIAMINGSFAGTDPGITLTYTATPTSGSSSSGSTLVAPVITVAMTSGLTLLASAVAPFVVIFGFWLALQYAMGQGDPEAVSRYGIGAIIAFSASLIGQLYYVFS